MGIFGISERLIAWDILKEVLKELLHALKVRTGPINALAVTAAVEFIVVLAGFRRQLVADGFFINHLQQSIAVQTPAERL